MDNLILTLKLINKIGNGTILKIINNTTKLPSNEIELHELILEKASNDKKIKVPTIDEIKKANLNANNIILRSKQENIKYIDILDTEFPQMLKNISSPPTLLFYKGNYSCLVENNSIAIVGTRNPTQHGEKIAHRLGYLFSKEGYIITSGLALGCDKYAHQGCLDADGRTVAVLGTSLDKISPIQNEKLAEDILTKNGCIITENYIGEKTSRYSFVNRNRIQSGLSLGTIVVETDIKGGTMETAKFTLEQGKFLGVYNHHSKFLNENTTKGNQELINNLNAISLGNKDDIEKFKKYIKEINNENISTQIDFNF